MTPKQLADELTRRLEELLGEQQAKEEAMLAMRDIDIVDTEVGSCACNWHVRNLILLVEETD